MSKSFREYTDYPNTYYCYWGQFRDNKEKNHLPDPIIIENRNKFAEEHKLVESKKKDWVRRPEWIEKYLKKIDGTDHIECYKDNERNYVVVFSCYLKEDKVGAFKKTYPIYSTDQTTYVLKFPPNKKMLFKDAYVDYNGCTMRLDEFN